MEVVKFANGEARCVQQANAILGEGPVWDYRSGDLFWVDIRRGYVFRHHLDSGLQTGQWVLPGRVGAVALTVDPGRILVAHGLQVDRLTLATGALETLCTIEAPARHRVNDAEVDANGRLWIGTMMDDYYRPEAFEGGRLHRVDPAGEVTSFGTYRIPNGIGWSLDNTSMYLNDSAAATTYVLDFDLAAGVCTNQRVFAAFGPGEGLPDGMSVDADGNVWSGLWDGWDVVQFSAEGRELARYRTPVRRPSSASFCGANLDRLAITSATVDFTSEDYALSPLAGGVFVMPVPARGRRVNLFGQGAPA